MGNRRKEKRALARGERAQKLNDYLGLGPGAEPPIIVGYERGAPPDSDERAAGQRHIQAKDISKTVRVPDGEWVDVRVGQVVAEGTYVDDAGVLRSTGDNSCVVWHNKGGGCDSTQTNGKYRTKIQPNEIIYDDNGAPWCPQCVANNQRKKIIDAQLIEKMNKVNTPHIFANQQPNRFYGEGTRPATKNMSTARRAELEAKFPVLGKSVHKKEK